MKLASVTLWLQYFICLGLYGYLKWLVDNLPGFYTGGGRLYNQHSVIEPYFLQKWPRDTIGILHV
jgi:hypothetical protein